MPKTDFLRIDYLGVVARYCIICQSTNFVEFAPSGKKTPKVPTLR